MNKEVQRGVSAELADGCAYHHYRQDVTPSMGFHSHDVFEFYFFIDGNVTYCIEEKTFELMSGDVLVIPPGKLHKPYVASNLNYERAVLSVTPELLFSLDKSQPCLANEIGDICNKGRNLISLRGKNKERIMSLLSDIDSEIRLGAENRFVAFSAYITVLLINLVRLAKSQEYYGKGTFVSESIVPSIIEYINTHLTEPLSSQSIADAFFISKYHLQHIFKQYTNVSLYDYILSKRIIFAKALIRQGKSLTDACFACGFKDYSAFYKAFVTKTGISPKGFKNSLKSFENA
ncbi:MAG: helix-turn-helix domain-containing protein [Clostridia bacterium]|nr:helix-turn-helix domain-containing protein [Clostridia bacterium]